MKTTCNATPLLDNPDAPLIMLSGTLCNDRLWLPVVKQLNVSHIRTVCLNSDDSAEVLAKNLLGVLPPRFCLAGFSLGAIVALQMLALAPQRMTGLALLSVNPFCCPPDSVPGRRAAVREAASLGLTRWLTENLWPHYVAPQRLGDLALQQTIVQMAEESGLDTFAHQTEVAISRKDHRAALTSFTSPVLIINGAHDVICPPSHHQAVANAAPHARWITLPESGHFLPLEAPQAVAIAMRNWIQESKP